MIALPAPDWWVRPGLEVVAGSLSIAGRDAEALARDHGTPLYVYDILHVEEQARAIQAALSGAGLRPVLRFALKSQREPEILAVLRALGAPGTPESCGIDACSPGEVEWALRHGWKPQEISFTGTNASDADLAAVLRHPVHVNVDTLSQLERLGRNAPGRSIGIRLNPKAGAAHQYVPQAGPQADTTELRYGVYSGARPTKFGVYPEQFDQALEIVRRHDLQVVTAHFHICHELLDVDLPAFDHALGEAVAMVRRLVDAGCPIAEINAGGGPGTPLEQGDQPLDLDAWAALMAKHLGPFGVPIGVEPGEFLTTWSGIVLARVVTVEERLGTTFVGLDVGWNAVPLRFVWGEFIEIVPCAAPLAPRTTRVTFSGHINEAPDLFAEDYPFPEVREGDVVALTNTGSYCQALASNHCMRTPPKAVFFTDRVPTA